MDQEEAPVFLVVNIKAMAGVQIGNLLGAASQITTALSQPKSLKSFLNVVNKFGVQVKNNFEVNFAGLGEVTFFITNISIPGLKQNLGEVYFNGRRVDVPINYDYEHEFTMTVLNDAQGYIYTAITNFIMSETSNKMANSGYGMTIKAMNGDDNYPGQLITMRGVRFESVSGLSFGHSDNDISTFDVSCRLIDFSITPGALSKVAGILGGASQLIQG